MRYNRWHVAFDVRDARFLKFWHGFKNLGVLTPKTPEIENPDVSHENSSAGQAADTLRIYLQTL